MLHINTTISRRIRHPSPGLSLKDVLRRQYTAKIVSENDIVLLRRKGDDTASPILSKPLSATNPPIKLPYGFIRQEDIIGKAIRQVVNSTKRLSYQILEPTLDEYVRYSSRLVTPIYPADANVIVSLLDLHPPSSVDDQNIEIFEAGTGHGGLTLHLARAIYGLGTGSVGAKSMGTSALPVSALEETVESAKTVPGLVPSTETCSDNAAVQSKEKGPKIQTLDSSAQYSAHAEKTVKQFRHGLYSDCVNFHVGTINGYLSKRLSEESEPFLSHAILDLPSCHEYLDIVGQALRPNGTLLVFCPSVTQIITCLQKIKEQKLPLWNERVVELGASIHVGGRDWDVRAVKPRALLKADEEVVKGKPALEAVTEESDESPPVDVVSQSVDTQAADSGWTMVCRPKVGGRISGGGFVAMLRRMEGV